ncbi:MAG: formylglycine-generating enzyme family protein [Bacteroidales bacterium]
MIKRVLFIFLMCFSLNFFSFNLFAQQNPNIEWVRVEKGSFMMGCEKTDKDCYPDEQPVHKITLSTFEISKYEVTVADYKLFCKATNKKMPLAPSWGLIDTHPIVYISWQDAVDYAKWIGGRLPTEAEWEFAARGGIKSEGYEFSGSNNYDEVGWCYENSLLQTHSVGQKKPNELGIYDMSGNAWEWVNDNYEIFYYQKSPSTNPQGPKEGLGKSNRGGCFNFDYKLMRVTHRRGSGSETVGFGTGFRVARDIKTN